MTMPVVLLVMLLSACWALSDLQGASDLSQHVKPEGENFEGEEGGICRVKLGKETHKGICDFSREKVACDSQYRFCDCSSTPPNNLPTKEFVTSS